MLFYPYQDSMPTFASDMLLHSELEYPVRKPVSGRLLFKLRKVLGKILLDPTRATHTHKIPMDPMAYSRPGHNIRIWNRLMLMVSKKRGRVSCRQICALFLPPGCELEESPIRKRERLRMRLSREAHRAREPIIPKLCVASLKMGMK